MNGVVYEMLNQFTNKKYIGVTTQLLETRIKQHFQEAYWEKGDNYNSKLNKAIRKYGKDSFIYSIIEEVDSLILFDREIYWIQYYNSYNQGYNSTPGGEGYHKYDQNLIYQYWQEGKTAGEICKLLSCNSEVVTTALLKHGITHNEIKFRSYNMANKDVILSYWEQGYSVQQIYYKANSKQSTIKRILMLNGIPEIDIINRGRSHRKTTPIKQFDLNGNYIQSFNSIKEANLYLGVDVKSSQISYVLSDKYPNRKTAYGYIWTRGE